MPGFSFPSAFGMSISISIVRVAGSSEPAMRAIVPLSPVARARVRVAICAGWPTVSSSTKGWGTLT